MKSQNFTSFNKGQAGLSLIELLFSIAIVAVVLTVAVVAYNNVTGKNNALTEGRNIITLQGNVKTMVPNPNYTGITEALVVQAGNVPSNMINAAGTGISNAWGGAVTIASADVNGGTANGFTITYPSVPRQECNNIVTSVGDAFQVISVGGTAVKDDFAATPVALTTAATVTNCDNTSNTVVLTTAG